ncbi:hypothetical protein GcM3_197021 [Golovinomyces cichoracearum]|uniref:Uncharacterized protein n=1 Tax=Golovinomyces cichoracearum TaxID=62708 RepID=A0A420HFC4_9PEZI|nr:hypothetical protein GcM3_197021 [Golovinomyces cichoracearum]
MNLTNVTQLGGQATYNIWSSTMIAVFCSMKLVEVVVDRMKSASNINEDERKAYESLSNSALGIFIQVVSPEILKCIIDMENPHTMWTHVKSEYHRDTPYALFLPKKPPWLFSRPLISRLQIAERIQEKVKEK